MFKKLKRDAKRERRQGYSVVGHVRRLIKNKGVAGVTAPLALTALIAAIAFANCRSSSITGPAEPTQKPTQKGTGGPTPGGAQRDVMVGKLGPFSIVYSMLPPQNPCTGETIVWDTRQSMMQGTIQSSFGLDGRYHAQFHFNSAASGVSETGKKYSGSQEYDSQDFSYLATDPTSRVKIEWQVKLIRQGEDGSFVDGDDFILHIVSTAPLPVDGTPPDATTYTDQADCR